VLRFADSQTPANASHISAAINSPACSRGSRGHQGRCPAALKVLPCACVGLSRQNTSGSGCIPPCFVPSRGRRWESLSWSSSCLFRRRGHGVSREQRSLFPQAKLSAWHEYRLRAVILRSNHFARSLAAFSLPCWCPPRLLSFLNLWTLMQPLYYGAHNKQVVETLKLFSETDSRAVLHRIIESSRLEKTSKIKSNCQPITTMPTKPCHAHQRSTGGLYRGFAELFPITDALICQSVSFPPVSLHH